MLRQNASKDKRSRRGKISAESVMTEKQQAGKQPKTGVRFSSAQIAFLLNATPDSMKACESDEFKWTKVNKVALDVLG